MSPRPRIVRPEGNGWDDALGSQKPGPQAPAQPAKPLQQSDLSTILGQIENPPAANPGNTPSPQYTPAQPTTPPQSGMAQYPPQLVIDVTNYVYRILKDKNLPTTPAITSLASAYSGEEKPAAYAHAKMLVDILGLEAFDIRNEQVEISGSQGSHGQQQGNTFQQIIQTIKNKPIGVYQLGQGVQVVSSGGNHVIDVNGHEIIIRNGQVVFIDGNPSLGGNLASALQGSLLGITIQNYACQSEFLTNPVPAGKLKGYITAVFGQVNQNSWLASAGLDDLLELSSLPQVSGIRELGFISELSSGPVKIESPFHSSYFIVMEMQPTNTRLLAARALDACYKDGTISVPSVTFYFPTQPYDAIKASSMDNRLAALKQSLDIPSQALLDEAQKLGLSNTSPHSRAYENAWGSLIARFTT